MRGPEVFWCFQGVYKETCGIKWVTPICLKAVIMDLNVEKSASNNFLIAISQCLKKCYKSLIKARWKNQKTS